MSASKKRKKKNDNKSVFAVKRTLADGITPSVFLCPNGPRNEEGKTYAPGAVRHFLSNRSTVLNFTLPVISMQNFL